MSPTVLGGGPKDEIWRQGPDLYGEKLRGMRGADASDLDEKTFGAWLTAKGLLYGLPHAIHTPMLARATTGKMWEINIAETAAIPSIHETSFKRRPIAVQKNESSTSEPGKVHPANKVALADSDLEEKLESGALVGTISENTLFRASSKTMIEWPRTKKQISPQA